METRTACLTSICKLLLFAVTITAIRIKELPHGILQNRQAVRATTAMYHLVVIFGTSETSEDVAFQNSIQEIKHVLQSKGNPIGYEFILARLEHIQEQHQQVTHSRTKRGILDFVSDIGKTLFGFGTSRDIEELKTVIDKNRDAVSQVVHSNNELVSIINTTRYELSENRKTINQLINATLMLKNWVEKVKLRIHMFKGLTLKLDILQEHVNALRRVKDKVLRMRKDLERGFLSEDLLPIRSLEDLINSPLIPAGSKFITPLHWYYSGLKVKLVSIDDELVYSIYLPLVSPEQVFATSFVSYPTPNLDKNVTIKVEVEGASILDSRTGQVTDITNQCVGTHPMVCPSLPVRRNSVGPHSCKSALLSNTDISKYCPVEITRNRQDQLIFHSINSYILVTWATEIVEECLRPVKQTLKAGTYMLEWDGQCSLCTIDHCIQGTILTGSTLRLNKSWQVLKLPEIDKFTDLKLANTLVLPSKLSAIKDIKLGELITEQPAKITWSRGDTSFFVNFVIIAVIALIICVGISYVLFFRKCKMNGQKPKESAHHFTKASPGREVIELKTLIKPPVTSAVSFKGINLAPVSDTFSQLSVESV